MKNIQPISELRNYNNILDKVDGYYRYKKKKKKYKFLIKNPNNSLLYIQNNSS